MKKLWNAVVFAVLLSQSFEASGAGWPELVRNEAALARYEFDRISTVRLWAFFEHGWAEQVYDIRDTNWVFVSERAVHVFDYRLLVPDTSEWIYFEVSLCDASGEVLFLAEQSFHLVEVGGRWEFPERASDVTASLNCVVPLEVPGLVSAQVQTVWTLGPVTVRPIRSADGVMFFKPNLIGAQAVLYSFFENGTVVGTDLSSGVKVPFADNGFWIFDPDFILPRSEQNVTVRVPLLTVRIGELEASR